MHVTNINIFNNAWIFLPQYFKSSTRNRTVDKSAVITQFLDITLDHQTKFLNKQRLSCCISCFLNLSLVFSFWIFYTVIFFNFENSFLQHQIAATAPFFKEYFLMKFLFLSLHLIYISRDYRLSTFSWMLAKSIAPRSVLLLFPGRFLSEINKKKSQFKTFDAETYTNILFVLENYIILNFSEKHKVKMF